MGQPFSTGPHYALVIGALLAFLFVMLPLGLIKLARNPKPDRLIYAGLVLLAALLVPTSNLTSYALHQLPRDVDGLLSLLIYLLPNVGLGLSAALLLFYMNLRNDGLGSSSKAFTVLALSALLLLKVLHNFYDLLAWDRTYDPLGLLYLLLPLSLALIFGGVLLVDLRGSQRWLSLTFLVLLPGLLFAIYKDTERIDIYQRTEANVQAITHAIEEYHTRTGRYPQELRRLSPWYVLAHPRPWIIAGQDWCYQSAAGEQQEADSYRLGYVFRDHWSSPNLIAKIAAEGGSPAAGGLCAAEIYQLTECCH